MIDWRRAEWQYKANVWGVRVMCLLLLTQVPEIYEAFKYHFPWWDDLLELVTIPLTLIARFVIKHTEMYRWDHDNDR